MARATKEWIGATDDSAVPPRVRLRVLERFDGRCDLGGIGCGRQIAAGDKWCCDHIKALINGGENRERNLHPLCEWCTPIKDAADVAEKSYTAARRKSHAGIKRKPKGRPMAGTKASGIRRRMDGSVERWR